MLIIDCKVEIMKIVVLVSSLNLLLFHIDCCPALILELLNDPTVFLCFEWKYTYGLEIYSCVFSKISQFLVRVLMEHIGMKNSLDSKLQFYFTCSIRIRSRK